MNEPTLWSEQQLRPAVSWTKVEAARTKTNNWHTFRGCEKRFYHVMFDQIFAICFFAFCRFSRSWKRKMWGMPEHLLLIRVSWTSAQLVETHCYGAIQDIGHTVISVSTNTQICEIFSAAHHSYAVGIFIQVSQFGTVILQFSVHFQHQIIKTLASSARRQDDALQCWSGKGGCDRARSWGFFLFDYCTGLLWQWRKSLGPRRPLVLPGTL